MRLFTYSPAYTLGILQSLLFLTPHFSCAQTLASPATSLFTGCNIASTANFGSIVANAGDMDGDGNPEIAVYTPSSDPALRKIEVFSKNASYAQPGTPPPCAIKIATIPPVPGVGLDSGIQFTHVDMNQDGRSELIVGIPSAFNDHGAVVGITIKPFLGVPLGSRGKENRLELQQVYEVGSRPTTTSSSPFGGTATRLGSRLGAAVAPLRLGTSASTVLVGAPGETTSHGDSGAVFELGMTNHSFPINPQNVNILSRLQRNVGGGQFGSAIAVCEAPAGSNAVSVVVGSPEHFPSGQVQRYTRSFASATYTNEARIGSGLTLDPGARFGHSIHCVGKLVGNTEERVVIGAPNQHQQSSQLTGKAFVFGTKHPSSLDVPYRHFNGATFANGGNDQFTRIGSFVRSLGDANGDGTLDVVYGTNPLGSSVHGNGLLYFDSLSNDPQRTYNPNTRGLIVGEDFGDRFAQSVDVIDWNNDGITDLLFGIPGKGQVRVIYLRAVDSYGSSQPATLQFTTSNTVELNGVTAPGGTFGLYASAQPANIPLTGLPGLTPARQLCIDPTRGLSALNIAVEASGFSSRALPTPLLNTTPGFIRSELYFQALGFVSGSVEATNCVRVLVGHR